MAVPYGRPDGRYLSLFWALYGVFSGPFKGPFSGVRGGHVPTSKLFYDVDFNESELGFASYRAPSQGNRLGEVRSQRGLGEQVNV